MAVNFGLKVAYSEVGELLHARGRIAAIERAVREDAYFEIAIRLLLDELSEMLGRQTDLGCIGVWRGKGKRFRPGNAGAQQ
jgi:hypothetical protein